MTNSYVHLWMPEDATQDSQLVPMIHVRLQRYTALTGFSCFTSLFSTERPAWLGIKLKGFRCLIDLVPFISTVFLDSNAIFNDPTSNT